MATSIRDDLAVQIEAQLASLKKNKEEITEAIAVLRHSLQELGKAGGRPRSLPSSGSPGEFFPRGAGNERVFLEALVHFGGSATGNQISEHTKRNTGTLYNAFTRLRAQGCVVRPGEKVQRSYVHSITPQGQVLLDQMRSQDPEASSPNGEVAEEEKPKSKPKRRKHIPPEEKISRIDEYLRKANGRVSRSELSKETGVRKAWLAENAAELQAKGILRMDREEAPSIPGGYRYWYVSPAVERETRVVPGEGMGLGRRFDFGHSR